jgi:hypothetical protein
MNLENDLENDVRTLLADQAQSAPSGVRLLTAVRKRSRRMAIARRAGVGGLVAIAVAASAVAVPMALRGLAQHSNQVGSAPSGGLPSPSPSSTEQASLRLEPVTTQPTVTFPYSPTFVPTGFPPATVIRTRSDFLMHARQQDNNKLIRVGIDASKPSFAGLPGLDGAKLESVTVRGHAGTIATGRGSNPGRFLFWQEKPGQWVEIYTAGVSRTDLLRYAEGLRQVPLRNTEAFHYALLPPGLVIHESLHYNTTFSPADAPKDADPIGGLVVILDDQSPLTGTRVQVGDHSGYLRTSDDGGRELVVDLGHHTTLSISFAGLNDTDLVRFAAGVTVDLSNI